MKELTCKVVLLGKESTGKTCLCAKFLSNEFRWGHSVTVGASYAAKKIETSKGRVVVCIWDTAGEEKFDSLTRLYYSGASAALICIDPTDSSSFSKSQYWVKELKQHQPECRCYIVLTKCDLLDQLTPFASPRISEEEPQSDTGHLKVVTAGCGGSGGSESPGEGHASVKSQQQSLSPTSPFEREYSGDAFAASSGSDAHSPGVSWQSSKSKSPSKDPHSRPRKEVGDSQLNSLARTADAKVARTSAVTGEGVSELFHMVAEDLAGSLGSERACSGKDLPEVAAHPEVILQRRESIPGGVRRVGEQSRATLRSAGMDACKGSCCS